MAPRKSAGAPRRNAIALEKRNQVLELALEAATKSNSKLAETVTAQRIEIERLERELEDMVYEMKNMGERCECE